eukprot:gb/GEZN01011266.1/.p1 GENE.gb/GEZN01011266.1/~~gb/GEZN01011266.1/.p1  ORF type:complete len:118 (+),score=3.66 gb/GEZN01011266.1/:519-872(+)
MRYFFILTVVICWLARTNAVKLNKRTINALPAGLPLATSMKMHEPLMSIQQPMAPAADFRCRGENCVSQSGNASESPASSLSRVEAPDADSSAIPPFRYKSIPQDTGRVLDSRTMLN